MSRKKWMILPILCGILLGICASPLACAEESASVEVKHFENTSKVMFYDEKGSVFPDEFLIEIRETVGGNGIPSPDNPRSISGYRGISIMHGGDTGTEPEVLTVDFPSAAGIVFGGTYDAVKGRLSVERAGKLVQGWDDIAYFNPDRRLVTVRLPGIAEHALNTDEELSTLLCDRFYTLETSAVWDNHNLFISKTSGGIDVCIKNEAAFTSKEAAAKWFAKNPVMISYQLEKPKIYYMDCAMVLSRQGVNVIWADTGRIKSFTCREARSSYGQTGSPLRILCFGNSFAFNTLNYVPTLLEELMPETEIVMGICHDSGCTLARHITKFNGGDLEQAVPAEYEAYYEYSTSVAKWINLPDTITPQRALDRFDWDIIILQQSVENLHDFKSLCDYSALVANYLRHPALLVYNIAQARSPGDPWLDQRMEGVTALDRSNRHFQAIADYAAQALNTPYISAVLPGGTAVQNLRTCSFAAETGDCGYFAKDRNGHLQQGIAPLAAGLAAACRIAELCRELPKLYGLQFKPSEEWLAEKQPFCWKSQGPCVGVTAENVELAKQCAMMALKHPYEVSDCSFWELYS